MIWLSLQQIKDLGVSKGILHRNRDKWTWRKTSERGRNGKQLEEVLLESMQTQWKEAWLKTQPNGSLTIDLQVSPDEIRASDGDHLGEQGKWETSGAEDRLAQALKRYDVNVRDAFLSEAQRLASIVKRFNEIKPKQIRGKDGKMITVQSVLDLCAETGCTSPEILAVEPARGKSRSVRTLYVWSTEFEKDGLAAFLRKPAEPTGKPDGRRAVVSDAAIEWINANWRKKPSPEKLHQALKREAAKYGWKIPSRGTIWRLYRSIGNVTKTIVFEGQKAYTSKHAPYVPRDVRDIGALQILVGDHSVRDITVMLPDGSLTRPWLTMWQDLRTGLIWGWHLDLSPSSVTIGLAYANGVQNFGAQPPADPTRGYHSYLYTDQGKDYRCKQIAGQMLEFKDENFGKAATIEGGLNALCVQKNVGLMNDLDLKHIMARGYNAREKFIERTHKDISEWEKNTFEQEYCGRGIGHKPERWVAAWHRHQKLLTKAGKNTDWILSESPFMTLDDYRDNLGGWISDYNRNQHTRAVLGGATVIPVDEYERLYPTRYEIQEETLAMLLMRAAKRKIGKNGVQFFQPHWYFLHEGMAEFKGREIEIRYTDQDYTRIWAVLPDGRIVESEMVGNSGVLNPNKRTMTMVAKQRAHEQKVAREHQLYQQSHWRGETVEDRVNAMLATDEPQPEPQPEKMVVNARPTVHALNRFDRLQTGLAKKEVTADDVAKANVLEGTFGLSGRTTKKRIKDEWED